MAFLQNFLHAAPRVAPDSIATIFGSQLALAIAQALALPLPAVLGGVSVSVRDRAGATPTLRLCCMFLPNRSTSCCRQISHRPSTLTVQSTGVTRAIGNLQIEAIAPGIFTQNADGKGVSWWRAATLECRLRTLVFIVLDCSS
jgi:uncharacterized protein (TIGR03437 family)